MYFGFVEFQSGKRPYTPDDVFVWKFREEKCLSCGLRVPEPELEHGPHRHVSGCFVALFGFICGHQLWVYKCPLHVCLCRVSVPERGLPVATSGNAFPFS